ncbi:MAG: methionine--tRNA ligase, partial [Vulcanimicrobiaceae bacterium]
LHPFMPQKMEAMWAQLGLEGKPDGAWRDEIVWGRLAAGTVTSSGEALFPRTLETVEAPA